MEKKTITIFTTPLVRTVMHWISRAFFKVTGWTIKGIPPDVNKFIIIGYPHTSNFDFILLIMLSLVFKLNVCWFGKGSLFHGPFKIFMRWLGGFPVDRQKAGNMVEEGVRLFSINERMILVIAPEGTRKKVKRWRTGFYYIAHGAGVPVLLGYVHNNSKTVGLGDLFTTTGDIEKDLKCITGMYEGYLAGSRLK